MITREDSHIITCYVDSSICSVINILTFSPEYKHHPGTSFYIFLRTQGGIFTCLSYII